MHELRQFVRLVFLESFEVLFFSAGVRTSCSGLSPGGCLAKIEKLAKTSNESVEKNTGKSWDYWIQILKKAGADNLTHKEIVQLLKTKHKLKPWWQQIVAGGFEVYIGRRNEGENAKGEYTVTVTKTLPANQKNVWKFITSPEGLTQWLNPMDAFKIAKGSSFEVAGGIFGEVRTLKAPKHIRLRWEDADWPKKTVARSGSFVVSS